MGLFLLLVGLALFERLVFDLGPNIELVTMASIVGGIYLPANYRLLVPVLIMAVSDMFLGVGVISIFTWTGFMVMAFLPSVWKRVTQLNLGVGLGSGVMGTMLFYVWTNFGVWATDRWGMYTHDASGLLASYVNALPFLRVQLLSTVLFVPLAVGVIELVQLLQQQRTAGLVRKDG